MKYFIKMKATKTGPRIEEMKDVAKKSSLSKYEIRYEEERFYTDSLKIAKSVRGIIRGTSKRLDATIYQKIQGKYYPLHTHENKTDAELEEIISLGNLSTKNKKEDK